MIKSYISKPWKLYLTCANVLAQLKARQKHKPTSPMSRTPSNKSPRDVNNGSTALAITLEADYNMSMGYPFVWYIHCHVPGKRQPCWESHQGPEHHKNVIASGLDQLANIHALVHHPDTFSVRADESLNSTSQVDVGYK